ncbi:MAG TPA: urea carboxylase-associated family protein [Streptosporangiaceae bacterium]|nr:urea carboxylase-associated family protein [Streptosporangiaceae bacterium]
MTEAARVEVPGGEGRGILVTAGQVVRVTDVAGGQVGDLFAFNQADPGEYASAGHTRPAIRKLFPRPGDPVLSNRRRPILTMVEDTSPGRHDMLYAACDPARYAALGAAPGHRSCAVNLLQTLRAHDVVPVAVPQPLNVFMDVRPEPDGTLVSHPASSRAGDFVAFRAELDCLVVLSSCPMDIVPISAGGITPLELRAGG